MFREWLKNNNVSDFDFSSRIFPPATDRAFWESKFDEEFIKEGEKYLNFSWPLILATDFMAFKNEGNRLKQETPFFERRRALSALVKAEILEHKGRFLPDILNGIFLICEETYWGVSAHFLGYYGTSAIDKNYYNIPHSKNDYIDLFAAETGSLIAITHNVLYDELNEFCPEILEYMEYELERRIVKPYLEHTDVWWMGYDRDVNNWNGWIISNLLTVFLLTEKDKNVLNKAVEKMIFEINRLYDRLPFDGGCDEGASYWTVSGGMIFEFCEQLYIATDGKINFFNDEKLRNIFMFEYNAYIGNGTFINFADGVFQVKGIHSLLYMIGKRLNSEKMISLSSEMFRLSQNVPLREAKMRREFFDLIYRKEIPQNIPFKYEDEIVLNDLQVCAKRNNDWFLAFKGGNNDEGHNHNDVGNFIVCYNNLPVICDAGCGVYTRQTFGAERYTIWTMRSDWHNLPDINGYKQKQGRSFYADKFGSSEVSFGKAYPEQAGVISALRKLELTKDGIEISDNFKFVNDKNTLCEHFITPHEVIIKDNCAIINGQFVLECDSPSNISVNYVDFNGDMKLTAMWNTDKMFRILFDFETEQNKEIKFSLRRI